MIKENQVNLQSNTNNLSFEARSKPIFIKSWLTPLWISIIITYSLILIGCIIEIVLSSINIITTSNNTWIGTLCIIFTFLMIFITSYFMYYSFINTKSTFKSLKIKSTILDAILLIYILMFYILTVIWVYLMYGINIKFINNLSSNVVMWFMITLGFIQNIVFIMNKYFMNKQSSLIKHDNKSIYVFAWWPNLVYSYWLDKAYFSLNTQNYKDNNIFIYNAGFIKSIPLLHRKYNEFFKWKNLFKRLVQNLFTFLFSTLTAAVVVLIASLFFWIHATKPNLDLIVFFVLFWVILSVHSWLYFKFVVLNKFQLIKDDIEDDISKLYDVIKIKFNQKVKQSINEKFIAYWLGIVRKILLYYSNLNFDGIHEQLINLSLDENLYFLIKFTVVNIHNKKWLNIVINEL